MTASSYDAERRPPEEREAELFARLPEFISSALSKAPGLVRMLGNVDPASLTSREALTALPVLQKSELMELQASEPPFAGFVHPAELRGRRIFMSPGPIWEPEGQGPDPAQAARAFRAAGARPGDIVHNAFSYHMTPGAFMMDGGARALGCSVFPAGTGDVDMQIEAAQALRPRIYAGTPDFLKIILDRAAELHSPLTSFEIGLVSGGALFLSLREEYFSRGIRVYQCYATAEFGVIAYESAAEDGSPHPGMIVNENLIVEIVRPGTGDPVAVGEVGELVVTSLDLSYPLLRVSTGDLSAVLPGSSPCGRTGMRIRGWMGRADQRTKVKGMFVDPKQVALVLARHPQLQRARLVVSRDGARDVMTLRAEADDEHALDVGAITATLRDVTKLGATVKIVAKGSLPNDGKVIADERDYSA